ncbi:MAG: transglycosylase domain-containing protein, partial [Nitriliruptorales bacterium]|nr:transglycosylase domain-containing protein [Nitriliruptorales bacterium]
MPEQPPDDAVNGSSSAEEPTSSEPEPGTDPTTQMDPVPVRDGSADPTTRMDPVGPGGPTGSESTPWYRQPRLWAYIVAGAAVVLGLLVTGAYWAIYASAEIPSPDELTIPDPTVVLDREGEEVARLDPASVRKNVVLDDLPEHVGQAVMAAEDRDFREHDGWSFPAIVRAAWANLRSGGTVQGASTITQQYVEIAVEDVDDSYLGKFREIAVAAKLDDELSK